MENGTTLDEQYWSRRYRQQETGWDIGEASTPLREYISQLTDKEARVLIPGCGNAHEAEWLVKEGFSNITLLDISSVLVAQLQQRFKGMPVRVILQDFFEHKGEYDLILEQTFFCALNPVHRQDYVRKMTELLRPGGILAGVLFDRDFEGGPPFGGNKQEYETLFRESFQLVKMEPCFNSIPSRRGTEVFFIARKPA